MAESETRGGGAGVEAFLVWGTAILLLGSVACAPSGGSASVPSPDGAGQPTGSEPTSPAPSTPSPLPAAPWSAAALSAGDVPAVHLSAWRSSENRLTCAPIAPASTGAAAAVAREAYFGGGWGVAYDLPGHRSAFGVAGTGVAAAEPAYDEWPFSLRWSDGSTAGYGPEGGAGPNQLAYLRISGQGCLYNVWSRLGREHLEHLLHALRFVEVEESPSGDLVVLVHGLGRSHLSMLPLEWRLEREGYEVLNWGYSSTCCSIDELARRMTSAVSARVDGGPRTVHFVGHSLGGIVIRRALAAGADDFTTGRVILLAAPNRGSRAADRLSSALGWLLRPLPELRTRTVAEAGTARLPDHVEVGVIAGRYDWKVSVDETRLPEMDSHVVVPATHTFLMLRPDVHRLILRYLRLGEFESAS